MENENGCYTYFSIMGNFEPDEITRRLGLTPYSQNRVGDQARRGSSVTYREASWKYGRCEAYDVFVENQMMATLRDLFPKINELNQIKRDFGADFCLEVVPEIYAGNDAPCLAPNRAVIRFLYETDTQMDIDLYIYERDDEAAPRQNTDKL